MQQQAVVPFGDPLTRHQDLVRSVGSFPAREDHMTPQDLNAVEAPMPPLATPNRLTSDHRLEFRRAVLEHLDQAARDGADAVELDMAATLEFDASGLGVLVLLRKRAAERGLPVRLCNAPRVVRQMLAATRLDTLFDLDRS
jgi:anti-anti-sigma factor